MSDSPVITFGIHKGKTVNQIPEDYVRWLADPKRTEPATGRNGRPLRPIDAAILEAARARMPAIEDEANRRNFARRCMGGHPTGLDAITYVIEMDGDGHSHSGKWVLEGKQFDTLDLALAAIAAEFPVETQNAESDEPFEGRTTPDPEDDLIVVWEVLPSGHRRPVWAFMGWHHSDKQESWACGQGTLPGDDMTLYELACIDY